MQYRYEKENITGNKIQSIILRLKSLPASDLYESNKKIIRWLTDGFILKREGRTQKDIHIELIDYSGLDEQNRRSADLDYIIAEKQDQYGKNHNQTHLPVPQASCATKRSDSLVCHSGAKYATDLVPQM